MPPRTRGSPLAGYSGTPLAKKLGIGPGSEVLAVHAPDGYRALLAPVPEGVRFVDAPGHTTDVVHAFFTRRAEMQTSLAEYRARIRPDAAVWVSWPKKASRVLTDVTEDAVREVALPMGWVDVKVCAVSDVWSALKLVIRKELRG